MLRVFIETIKDSPFTEDSADDILFNTIEIDANSIIDIDGLGEKIRIKAKKALKFRIAKAAKNAVVQ